MIASPVGLILLFVGATVGLILLIMLLIYVVVPLFRGIGWLIGRFFWFIGAAITHIGRFIVFMIRDSFRAVGAIPTAIIFALLSTGSVVIGRWSAAAHFADSMKNEFKTLGVSLYRIALAHPLRLVGLDSMLEGIEQRVPAALADAPGPDKPRKRTTGTFDGYQIVGSLPGGGSGGKLYIAVPSAEKNREITRNFGQCPDRVVIKAFAIADGSSLPQIVRESRALEAARHVGLILDHDLTPDRFYYAMPYVPGEKLSTVTAHIHGQAGDRGLSDRDFVRLLGYVTDVVDTIDHYHHSGLWHKDIKPDNIIIHDNRAHVVDLGLVTPLRSAMTLTTHGTEYYRDPEMVKMALKGMKVHEVDGAKFDIYAAGAVLYHVIENTFPSHGGLSVITHRCPEVVKWIVRRAMAEYNKRYPTADLMLADLRAALSHQNIWKMKPVDLPSMRSDADVEPVNDRLHAHAGVGSQPSHHPSAAEAAAAAAGFAAFAPAAAAGGGGMDAAADSQGRGFAGRRRRRKPKIRVVNWWTGAMASDGWEAVEVRRAGNPRSGAGPTGDESTSDEWRQHLRDAQADMREAAREASAAIRAGVSGARHSEHARRLREAAQRAREAGLRAAAAAKAGHGCGGGDRPGANTAADAMMGAACAPRACHATWGTRGPAEKQVKRARRRAATLQLRAQKRSAEAGRRRAHRRDGGAAPAERTPWGAMAAVIVLAGMGFLGWVTMSSTQHSVVAVTEGPQTGVITGPMAPPAPVESGRTGAWLGLDVHPLPPIPPIPDAPSWGPKVTVERENRIVERWDGLPFFGGDEGDAARAEAEDEAASDRGGARVRVDVYDDGDLWSRVFGRDAYDDALKAWAAHVAKLRFDGIDDAAKDLAKIARFYVDEPRGFLVVNDHPNRLNPEVQRLVNLHIDSLTAMGLNRVENADYEARVRLAVERHIQSPYAVRPGSSLNEAENAMGELMGDVMEEVGCVLWLYPLQSDSDAVGVWVTVPGSVKSDIDDRMLHLLLDRSSMSNAAGSN